jgi:hypothetical protein
VKQKQFSVDQIVAALKQAEAGVPVAELIRRPETSDLTFRVVRKKSLAVAEPAPTKNLVRNEVIAVSNTGLVVCQSNENLAFRSSFRIAIML